MRLATFNLQNLRLRIRDGQPALDPAADLDGPEVARVPDAGADRRLTAEVITQSNADIVALQEVFDAATLEYFHDTFLVPAGSTYPFRYCLPGNDGRGRDVAALSRRAPLNVQSHARCTGADLGLFDLPERLRDRPLFRRDCLRLDFQAVSLFVCHLKAPYPDPEAAFETRNAEARGLRRIIETAFPEPARENWIVIGDFNEPKATAAPSALEPLTKGFAIDLMDRLPAGTDWTYEAPVAHAHSRPDRIFVSQKLARDFPKARPEIIRTAMQPTNEPDSPRASDHALICVDLPGL